MRDGRPSSLATTEVPALIKTRRAFLRALRDSSSFGMVSTNNMRVDSSSVYGVGLQGLFKEQVSVCVDDEEGLMFVWLKKMAVRGRRFEVA